MITQNDLQQCYSFFVYTKGNKMRPASGLPKELCLWGWDRTKGAEVETKS